jgi:hypothetical protein
MIDNSAPLPSRRAQREAREAAERAQLGQISTMASDFRPSAAVADELPSRRELRRRVSGNPEVQNPDRDNDQWAVPSTTVGQALGAVKTLHIERFPTGEISGPIDHTGEIILTGPIEIPVNVTAGTARAVAISASPDIEAPGIPRRATEALSIIGRGAPIDEKRRIPSIGGGISAGFATFLGLLVLTLIGLAFFTDLI